MSDEGKAKKRLVYSLDGVNYEWWVDVDFEPTEREVCDWLVREHGWKHGITELTPDKEIN